MVITYYQRSPHLFGKLKLEVLDPDGKLVDTLPASKRPGINRVNWSMNVKPPRVPPAASVAGSATQGPRAKNSCADALCNAAIDRVAAGGPPVVVVRPGT